MALLSVRDAAERLGVSVRRVRALIGDGRLPATKVGPQWVIDETDLERFAAQPRTPGRPPRE